MRTMHPQQRAIRQRRPGVGFTLLELLIVIGVITLLFTIAGAVVGNIIRQARINATLATILKIDGLLQQRLEAFRVLMEKPQRQAELSKAATDELKALSVFISTQRGQQIPPISSQEFGKFLVKKRYFRSAFPQVLTDNPGISGFASNTVSVADSAELLYWTITKSDVLGSEPVDDSEFSSSEVGDSDNDGLREFVDSWGRPLRFYRWPTRLIRPEGPVDLTDPAIDVITQPAVNLDPRAADLLISGLPVRGAAGDADMVLRDPDDLQDLYLSTILKYVTATNRLITVSEFELMYHTPLTYHIPLVVSLGPDGQLGLYEPNDAALPNRLGRPRPANQFDDGAANSAAANPTDWVNSSLNDNLTNRQKQK